VGLITLVAACPAARAADERPTQPADPLESVTVTARHMTVETLIDRKVYTVTSDLQSTFGALSDILTNIPSVNVDSDGAVSLRGDTNVLILIDGKPSSQFSGPSAGDNLQSIPAKDIERIEILTTPPAQYKAEGAAGVINIITRKKHSDGLTGSVQGSIGNGNRTVDGASGSYRSGPIIVSTTASYRHDFRDRELQSSVSTSDPAAGQLASNQSSTREMIRRSVPTIGISSEYALNDHQTLTASVMRVERDGQRQFTQVNGGSDAAGSVTTSSHSVSARGDVEKSYDYGLGFTRQLAREGEALDVSLSRWTSQLHEHYDYASEPIFPPSSPVTDSLSLRQHYGTTEVGADYTLPVSKTQTFKAGFSFESDDYQFDDSGTTVADNFRYQQRVSAAYASYQATRAEWTWLPGLRAERASTDTRQLLDDTSTSVTHLRLFPSLHIDRTISDEVTLSFGGSRRVTRPDPENLNPYVDREYTPNLHSGNPTLKPEYTQSYEAGYEFDNHQYTYSVTTYYRRNRDSVTDLIVPLGDGVTLSTKENLPSNNAAGLEVTTNGRIGQKLTFSVSGDLFHRQIDATALGISGLQSTNGLNAKLKLDYRTTTDGALEVTATRTDKVLTPQGNVSAINIVNLGYKHQLRPDLSAIATLSDVFDGQRFRRYTAAPDFTQQYERDTRGRILYLGLVYSAGARKGKQPKIEYEQ
jgi:outer membrane receptor for ferrienterochelin and colicin